MLWDELNGLINNDPGAAWCILGDFNVICSIEDRCNRSEGDIYEDFSHFNQFIEGNFLIDLPLCGRNFNWYHEDGMSMIRLDRFLLSEKWVSYWPNCIQSVVPRGLSNHYSIMFMIEEDNWGSKPQRLLKCWAD